LILRGLRLKNYRQHIDTDLVFGTGLVGIVGPNGVGKSTILEAIAWAIYGMPAARGTSDTIRYDLAPARSRVEVELVFALGATEYRVLRTMHDAMVYVDGSEAPAAASLGGVTEFLTGRLGMTRAEFFNTYFTGQKALQFLPGMGGAERARFFSRVLGHEKLRVAQERAKEAKRTLRAELDGLRRAMPDGESVKAELVRARLAAKIAAGEQEGALAAFEAAVHALSEVEPLWDAAKARREEDRELAASAREAEREAGLAEKDLKRIADDLAALAGAEASLAELREGRKPLAGAEEECERWAKLRDAERERNALLAKAKQARDDLSASAERYERLTQAPGLVEKHLVRATEAADRHKAATAEHATLRDEWVREKSEADADLRAASERLQEREEQLLGVEAAGEAGACPACTRPMDDEYAPLRARMEVARDEAERALREAQSRANGARIPPAELANLAAQLPELARAAQQAKELHVRCEAGVAELATLGEERDRLLERVDSAERQAADLPSGYDADAHRLAEASLRSLRETETQIAVLEARCERRAALQAAHETADREHRKAADLASERSRARAELAFDPDAFRALEERESQARAGKQAAELALVSARSALAHAEAMVRLAEDAVTDLAEKARACEELEDRLRLNDEVDVALGTLREELNARIRPEIGEEASLLLEQITDGRYATLELDENYEIRVFDAGRERPVLSGGEEDVAHLALRIALSQMVAAEAGQSLSLLILDEVFGSLDQARRDNVVAMLHHLGDQFEQVLVISHVEGLHDAMTQVIELERDEKTGAARVRQPEPLAAGPAAAAGTDPPILLATPA
jgi:DNA repair protein SbcC/Rad50